MPSTAVTGIAQYEMFVSHSPPVFSHSPPSYSDYGPNLSRYNYFSCILMRFRCCLKVESFEEKRILWSNRHFLHFSQFHIIFLCISSNYCRYFDPSRSLCRTQSLTPIQCRQRFQKVASQMPSKPKRPCLVVKNIQPTEKQTAFTDNQK